MKRQCLSNQEIEQKLADVGVQSTVQRIAICKYVLCEANHPTADQVKEWADKNLGKVSLATVYNTLKTLVESGLLREFRFPHSDKVFYDCTTEDHFHFVDEKSEQIYDIDPKDVELKFNLPKKFKIKDIKVIFKGSIN
jgi:Fur family iron response transcriptional regulator